MQTSIYTAITQKSVNGFNRSMMRLIIAFFAMLCSSTSFSQLTGIKNIPGDYASLAAAVSDLNTQGVGVGGVTLNLLAGNPEIAPPGGYVIGGAGSLVLTSSSAANPVIISGNGNTITAGLQTATNLNDAIFKLSGADWVTLQNFVMIENAGNSVTTVSTNTMTEWGVALLHASLTDGAQNNTIQNNTISLLRTYLNSWGIYSNVRHNDGPATADVTTVADVTDAVNGPNKGNKVYGNSISNVNLGIAFIGSGTAANHDTGNDVGGSSALTGNSITNYGGGSAAPTLYASNTATPYCIYFNHQKSSNASYNTIVSANISVSAVMIGIFSDFATSSPTGTFTNHITNNTLTINNTVVGAQQIQVIRQNNSGAVPNAAATININNNQILNCSISGVGTTTSIIGVLNTAAFGTLNFNGNIMRGTTVSSVSGNSIGIFNTNTGNAAVAVNMNNNQIGNPSGGAITFTAASTTSAFTAITNQGGTAATAVSISGNDFRGITYSGAGSGANTYISNTFATLSQNISNNTFTNLSINSTGSVTFLSDNVTLPAGGSKTINNNSISGTFAKTLAGGTVTFFVSASLSPTGTTNTMNNNNFSNITVTGTTTIAGWNQLEGNSVTTGPAKTFTGNTFSNITGGTNAVTVVTFSSGIGTDNISNNTISNINSQGNITGLSIGVASNSVTASQNIISGLSSSGLSAVITGIAVGGGTSVNVNNNTVSGLTGTGTTSPVANGISVAAGTTVNINKNKICNIAQNGAISTTTPAVNGMLFSGGTTVNAINNLVGDLRAPAASLLSAIRGISVTNATAANSYNIYNNTVYLAATSSGANFGTTGIFHVANATANVAKLDLRNNIVVNNSTPNGTGIVSALARSVTATYGNYAATSTNNLLSAGILSANHAILDDNGVVFGSAGAAFAFGPAATVGTFQNQVAPREAASFSEVISGTPGVYFQSLTCGDPTFLHLVNGITTQAEGGGATIPGVTTDFDNDTRNTVTPDAGADEFNGITPAPTFSNVSVPVATCTVSAHVINADIATLAGNITTVNLNYNNGSPGSVTMNFVSGSTYTGTIPAGTPGTTVTWSIVATNDGGLSSTFIGTPYKDDPLFGVTATAVASVNPVCAGSPTSLSVSLSGGAPAITSVLWSDAGTANPYVVNPLVNTDYSVVVTAAGCTVTSNLVSVVATPLPAGPVNGPSVQCGTGVPTCFATGTSNGNYRWYLVPTGGTAIPGEQNDVLGSYSISTTTTFYVSIFNGTCESLREPVLATVNLPDPVAASSDGPVCANSPLSLTATVTSGTNGNTYAYTWSASPASGSGIPTTVSGGSGSFGSPSSTPVTPTVAGSYIYTVNAVDGACATSATVNVTVVAQPQIFGTTATPSTICEGASTSLNVNTTIVNVNSGPAPTYCVASVSSTGGCINTLTFNTLNNNSPACASPWVTQFPASGSTTTSVNRGQSYNLFLNTDGLSLCIASVWIDYNRNGVYEATEWTQVFTASTSGNVSITIPANATTGLTGMRVRTRFAGNVNGSGDACIFMGSGEVEDYTITIQESVEDPNLSYVWNPGALPGRTVVASPTVTTTYTATVTSSATGCSSTSNVTVTVNPLPAAPSSTSSEQCGAAIPTATVTSNSVEPVPVFNWYTQPTGGTSAQTGTLDFYNSVVSVTTIFYVSETNGLGCESARTPVTVTVEAPDPLTVSATATTLCLGSSTDISAAYTPDFNIFTSFTLTVAPEAGSGITNPVALTVTPTGTVPLTVTPSAPGTYIYTITAVDPVKGCTISNTVTVTVNPIPTGLTAGSNLLSVCSGNTVNLSSSISNQVLLTQDFETFPPAGWTFINAGSSPNQWNGLTNGQFAGAAHTGNAAMFYLWDATNAANAWAFTPGQSLGAGTPYTIKFWYRTVSQGGAFPEKMKVTVGGNNTVAAQTTILWNNNGGSNLTNEIYAQGTATFTPSAAGTYYFAFHCFSDADNNFMMVDDVEISATTTYSWTSTPPGFVSAQQNPQNVQVNATTTYSVTATFNGGCTSSAPAVVTVTAIPLPNAPSGNNSTQCGTGVPAASVTTGGANGTFIWYDLPTGGTALQTGGSSFTGSISATTIFYVSESDGTCESLRTAVTATVTPAPVLVVTPSGATAFCPGGSVSLDATTNSDPSYVNFSWSANPSLGSGLSPNNLAVVTAAPTIAGTYIYTVVANDGILNGCSNTATISVTLNPNPVIDSVRANPPVICAGSSTISAYSSIPVTGPQSLPAVYCNPVHAGGTGITSVIFNTLSNTGIAQVSPYYDIYPASGLTTTTVNAGQTYTISLTTSSTSIISVWIDYNRNGVFEPSEWTQPWTSAISGSANITIPVTAAPGITAMRVRSRGAGNVNGATDACITFGGGTAQDYSINVVGINTQNPAFNYSWNPGGLSGSNVVVSPVVTTTYTATVLNPVTGCSATAPVTVTFTPVIANATATPSTVCAGAAVQLNANASGGIPLSFSWSDGGGVIGNTAILNINPLVTTTYTVTVTDGCSNTTSSPVTVTVNPLPLVTITPSSASICQPGASAVSLTAGGASTYAWSPAAGLSAIIGTTVNALPSGSITYTVTGTDGNGCISTATSNITVNPAVTGLSATATPATICTGANAQLQAAVTPVASTVNGYAFASSTGATLNPMAGATQVIGSGVDDAPTASPAPIGFSFNYNGQAYTNFSVSPDGWILLGNGTAVDQFTNSVTSATNTPKIYPYWDDMTTGTNGNVTTLVTGSAPNRIFIVQWFVSIPYNIANPANTTFQAWLYENGGKIEFRYAAMAADAVGGASVGLTGSPATNYQSVTVSTNTSSTTTPNNNNFVQPASGRMYTFTPVTISYLWSPATFISGQETLANPVATAVNTTTTYTVTATYTGGCTAQATTTVTAVPVFVSPTPGPVSGLTNVCPYIGLGNPAGLLTYSVPQGPVGTVYSWIVPPTCTLVSGQGTNTITLLANVGFIANANKLIRVRATEPCGTISAERLFYLLAQFPNTPGPIAGPNDACPLLGSSAVYSVAPVAGAASYIWTAQLGTTITPAGAGPLGNSVTISFPPTFTTSAITVQTVNDCGVSGIRSITVTRTSPSTPSPISGPTNACAYIAPGGIAATYSVPAVAGVTYTWTAPPGAIGLTGQGTNSISFTYATGFISGVVSVIASNGCGTSGARNLTVTKLNPATPSVIDVVNSALCPNRQYTYSLAGLPANATSVQWVVPTGQGAVLVSGQGTTSIIVTYPATAIDGAVTAQAVSNCAVSVIRSTSVKLAACPVEPPPPPFTGGDNNNSLGKGEVAPVAADMMSVNVYPNPTTTDFKLQVITAGKEEISVRVLDMQGRFFKQVTAMPYQTINIGAELRAGAYMIEVRQGKQVKTTRVLKF